MSDKKRIIVLAALPYSNGASHVGHLAGAYLPSDTYVRFKRLRGHEVLYVCGSDDHGVAIMLTAAEQGKTPQEIADYYHDIQERDFKKVGVEFDVYGSTSRNPYHAKVSQEFFKSLYEKGLFEKQTSRQFFDESKDMFLPDRYVKGDCGHCGAVDQHGDQCENCGEMLDVDTLTNVKSVVSGNDATIRETVHWFLDLSKCQDDVAQWIEEADLREHTKNYVKGLISTGFVKRSMTRDIDWGIPVPLDDPDAAGKVLYVWFDAPIGYISNTIQWCTNHDKGESGYEEYWKNEDCDIVHFIGEDNTIFHCVIWIAMLKAEGSYSLPKAVVVNQFLNIQFPGKEEEKISKSRGNAVWLGRYVDEGGSVDALRYYLTSIAPERARTAYNPEDLKQKNNSDLANTLGNFVNRIVSFTHKYVGPNVPECDDSKVSELDREFRDEFVKCYEETTKQLEAYGFRQALDTIMSFVRACNKYVDAKEPWVTRKTDMETTQVTLRCGLEAIYGIGVLLLPFLPDAAEKILKIFQVAPDGLKWEDALVPPQAGSVLEKPEILFQKIEIETEQNS